ncbi:MAG: 2-C-methyl-D-erythritol 2,4-cyclodiphosphate synthase [Deltaproteobacteria bacterium]|nr:2-C-methyl-D-erythritol 2,4-cyclodiphosphate synthase [Deltaproteobacteria bacterium]
MRSGIGYDIHRLVSGRKLILGGVDIPFEKGLLGHSDADVLIHAVCDALLGAAALGDIGIHFPDTDAAYKGISSMVLLDKTVQLLESRGFSAVNVDITILAQAPKLSPFRKAIQENIAGSLHLAEGCVNVKATTTEGLGAIGNGEGIAALCVAMINQRDEKLETLL